MSEGERIFESGGVSGGDGSGDMISAATVLPRSVRGCSLRAVSDRRWRVIDRRGVVIGHVRREQSAQGTRFHAERFELARARMRELGSFCRLDEAVECLAYLR